MRQRGVAVLLLMLIIVMMGIYLLTDQKMMNAGGFRQEKTTLSTLVEARDALAGRAVKDENRPGSLPCPDANNDGVADMFYGNECPSYIGRLPWKTLDLPDLRDGAGERLWYALSRSFRDHPSAEPINSDTKGSLKVFAPDGATDLTQPGSEAVAVIFAPGTAIGNQIRDTVVADCPATGTRLGRNLCANNYLEAVNCPGSNCRNNASGSGPYIYGQVMDANGKILVNDTLLVVRARDIMPVVEKRVAKELKGLLQAYYAQNGYYPYPAKHDDCNGEKCDSNAGACRGRFPLDAGAAGAAQLVLPSWFIENQWYTEIYYSVGADALQSDASLSPACNPKLDVSGVLTDALFFTPGTPIGAVVRPSDALSDYLEDGENRDGWAVNANDRYVVPTSLLNDRDRVYTLP